MNKNDQDSAWKEVLDFYLKECMDYCIHELSALIDWQLGYTSLDKELCAITKSKAKGKRIVDKLFKVFLKNGKEQWILLHLEVQGSRQKEFPERMFTYAYRCYDKYKQPIVSIAILTDNQPNWRPNKFTIGMAGSYLSFEFLVIKLLDYRNKQAELDQSMNPFASIILSQLAALQSTSKPHRLRKEIKVALIRRLYTKGFTKETVLKLFEFIDWLIALPENIELEYANEIQNLEEDTKMAYMTSIERLGFKRGFEQGIGQGVEKGFGQGIEQGHQQIALKMLKKGYDEKSIAELTGLNEIEIERLKESVKEQECI